MASRFGLVLALCSPLLAEAVEAHAEESRGRQIVVCSVTHNSQHMPIYESTPCRFDESKSPTFAGVAITSIASTPPGARLTVNGVRLGNTPAQVVFEPPSADVNSFSVLLHLDGYQDETVTVRSGDVITVPLQVR